MNPLAIRSALSCLSLGSVLLAVACGGSSGPGGGSTVYTLDNVCTLIPAKLCEKRKPCCERSGLAYDAAACEARERADCDKDVAEVKAETMRFNPAPIDSCIELIGKFNDKCTPTLAESIEFLPQLGPCMTIFDGNRAEGEACQRGSQCAHSTDPNTLTSCDGFASKCQTIRIASEGGDCAIGGEETKPCAANLYCDGPLTSTGVVGKCRLAKALGASCEIMNYFECGYTGYCDFASRVCTPVKRTGESCQLANECASSDCNEKKCAAPKPVVDLAECSGSGSSNAPLSSIRTRDVSHTWKMNRSVFGR